MQELSISAVANFLETALFEFGVDGNEGAIGFLDRLEAHLALCVQGKQPVDDALLKKIAGLLQCGPVDDCPETIARSSLHVGQLWWDRSKPTLGIASVRLAIAVAKEAGLDVIQRRAHNMMAALLIDDGQPALAVEHAGRSVRFAEKLKDPIGVGYALTNLASGLYQQGLYREAINVTRRVVSSVLPPPLGVAVKGQATAVLAEAALAIGENELAAHAAKSACDALPNVPGRSGNNRLAALGVALRAAIATGNIASAKGLLAEMENGIAIKPSVRSQINVALARANVMMAEGHFDEAVSFLEQLQKTAATFPPLQRDHLGTLIGAYQKAGRSDKALVALSHLVDQLGNAHMNRLSDYLRAIDEPLVTPMPGKEDAHRFVRNVQRTTKDSLSGEPLSEASSKRLSIDALTERQVALERLAVSAELKEDAEGFHAFRVGRTTALLAEALGYGSVYCRDLELAARLHDIGKLSVPDGLLLKAGPLTETEWTAVRMHTIQGEDVISIADRGEFRLAHQIAGGHHERWDGTGYPRRLKGQYVPEAARIAQFADVYDALTHQRVYKHAWTHDEAMAYIVKNAGTIFDPRITEVFRVLGASLWAAHRGGLDHWLRTTATASPILTERTKLNELIELDNH